MKKKNKKLGFLKWEDKFFGKSEERRRERKRILNGANKKPKGQR